MLVYRLESRAKVASEHGLGKGPYRYIFGLNNRTMADECTLSALYDTPSMQHPTMCEDITHGPWWNHGYHPSWYFCFRSLDDLHFWFDDTNGMKKNNDLFCIAVYNVETYKHGDGQSVFNTRMYYELVEELDTHTEVYYEKSINNG